MRPRPRAAALLAGAFAIAASCTLTGCMGAGVTPAPRSSTDGTQTVSAACDVVRASVADAVTALQNLDTGDPQAAAATMAQVADRLGAAADTVNNSDVAALLPKLQTSFTTTGEILQAVAGGDLAQLPALQQSAGDIQSAFEKFTELCATP